MSIGKKLIHEKSIFKIGMSEYFVWCENLYKIPHLYRISHHTTHRQTITIACKLASDKSNNKNTCLDNGHPTDY